METFQFFGDINASLESESQLREQVRSMTKDLERQVRFVAAMLNSYHGNATKDTIRSVCEGAKLEFVKIRECIAGIAKAVPEEQYYRYNQLWNLALQQSVFLAALVTYLQQERLIRLEEIQEYLGIPVSISATPPLEFHIGLEDFLHGLLSLAGELSRLAVNSVTVGEYQRPTLISKFVTDLYSGFQLLNLKNDSLRKRYDSMKVCR
jgi:predicted translin family RNA/ssDNA-binding protein